MIDVQIKIENADRIIAALEKVTKKVQRKVISAGCRAGAKLIQQDAKTRAPKKSGLLRKAIRVRVSKRVGTGNGTGTRKKKRGEVSINAQIGKGDFRGETFYGAFQEYGWKSGKRVSKGTEDNRRQIAGKHFMENAYKAQRSAALSAMTNTILEGLEKAVREEAVK